MGCLIELESSVFTYFVLWWIERRHFFRHNAPIPPCYMHSRVNSALNHNSIRTQAINIDPHYPIYYPPLPHLRESFKKPYRSN